MQAALNVRHKLLHQVRDHNLAHLLVAKLHALHQGVKKLSRRIQGVEERAAKRGSDIGKLSLNEILALWKDVKKAEKKR